MLPDSGRDKGSVCCSFCASGLTTLSLLAASLAAAASAGGRRLSPDSSDEDNDAFADLAVRDDDDDDNEDDDDPGPGAVPSDFGADRWMNFPSPATASNSSFVGRRILSRRFGSA